MWGKVLLASAPFHRSSMMVWGWGNKEALHPLVENWSQLEARSGMRSELEVSSYEA